MDSDNGTEEKKINYAEITKYFYFKLIINLARKT